MQRKPLLLHLFQLISTSRSPKPFVASNRPLCVLLHAERATRRTSCTLASASRSLGGSFGGQLAANCFSKSFKVPLGRVWWAIIHEIKISCFQVIYYWNDLFSTCFHAKTSTSFSAVFRWFPIVIVLKTTNLGFFRNFLVLKGFAGIWSRRALRAHFRLFAPIFN